MNHYMAPLHASLGGSKFKTVLEHKSCSCSCLCARRVLPSTLKPLGVPEVSLGSLWHQERATAYPCWGLAALIGWISPLHQR